VKRLLLVLVVLLTTACGVPQEEQPRALLREDAPFRIFDSQVAPPPQGVLQAELWFLRGEQPVPLPRPLELPGSPQQVLEQLLGGPTEAELGQGLSSALPDTLDLIDLTVTEGVAVVTLAGLNEQVQVPAYAQIVATLDGRPDISGVRFRTPDGDVPVPRGEGGLSSEALTREDYAVLLGLRPAPPLGSTATPTPGPPADAD
jgi:hypothetical protein